MTNIERDARSFFRGLFILTCWNEERMQNLGFAFGIEPWLERIYPRGDRRGVEARGRHLEFFNTQPYMAGIIVGVTARLEETAFRSGADPARADALKSAMASALAGAGDAFFWGALRPFALACALLAGWTLWFCGWPAAACLAMCGVFLAVFNIPALRLRWTGAALGYEKGEGVVRDVERMGWLRRAGRLKSLGKWVSCAAAAAALFFPPFPGAASLPVRAAVLGACLLARRAGAKTPGAYGLLVLGGLAAALCRR